MSLLVSADGILQTHLHWEELQESVLKAFGPDAKFGPNKDAKDVGMGRGIMSKICLITPNWETKSDQLPERFVVKICSLLSLGEGQQIFDDTLMGKFNMEELINDLERNLKKNHNREVNLYRVLGKHDVTDIPLPKIYLTREFAEDNPLKGYIIMECLANGLQYHLLDNLKPDLMLQPLRALAKVEAISLRFSEEEREPFLGSPYEDVLEKFFTKEGVDAFMASLRSLDERLSDKIDLLNSVVHEIDTSILASLPDELGMRPVLCHGDLWSTNLMWRQGKNEAELAGIVDFQTAHFGCPSVDIVRLFTSCMSGRDRRKSWETLLEDFYAMLEGYVAGDSMPYSLNMLKVSYKRFFPLCALMVIPMVVPVFKMTCMNMDDLERKEWYDLSIVKPLFGVLLYPMIMQSIYILQVRGDLNPLCFKGMGSPGAGCFVVKEAISEKVGCILEDVVQFHIENRK